MVHCGSWSQRPVNILWHTPYLSPTLLFYRNECVEKKDDPEVFFCCCEGSMCNKKFSYNPDTQTQIQSKFVFVSVWVGGGGGGGGGGVGVLAPVL